MNYFITGASGFIGKRLVRKLLERDGSVVYFLVRALEADAVAQLREYWGADESRAIPVVGDLTQPLLGVSAADKKKLGKKITHFFHLAAIYDLKADAESQQRANVDGTRNTVQFAEAIGTKHFHLFSSIASAGLFEGLFREDMFEEAENLDHPYFATKHESEPASDSMRTMTTLPGPAAFTCATSTSSWRSDSSACRTRRSRSATCAGMPAMTMRARSRGDSTGCTRSSGFHAAGAMLARSAPPPAG